MILTAFFKISLKKICESIIGTFKFTKIAVFNRFKILTNNYRFRSYKQKLSY